MGFDVTALTDEFGAEITGLDISNGVSESVISALKDIFYDAGVMVIRGQIMSPEDHIAFSRRFGNLMIHVLDQFLLPGHPEILQVSNKKDADGTAVGLEDAGRYWHSDILYEATPAKASMLYALEIPPEGGDTLYIDMRHAYDTLPVETRNRLAGLRGFHSYTANFKSNVEGGATRPDLSADQTAKLEGAWHPLARTHEDTGRKSLYVSPGFTKQIEGMAPADGSALLQELFDHATENGAQYRHVWKPNDLLCWDNRSVMHHATLYDPAHSRHMHRTTIEGGIPAA